MGLSEEERLYQYKNRLYKRTVRENEFLDKALLTLSAGALIVSVSFIDKAIDDRDQIVFTELLIGSWWLWTGCLISILLTFLFSKKSIQRVNKKYCPQKHTTTEDIERLGGFWRTLVSFFYYVNIALFIAGAVSMTTFACLNAGGNMLEEPQNVNMPEFNEEPDLPNIKDLPSEDLPPAQPPPVEPPAEPPEPPAEPPVESK